MIMDSDIEEKIYCDDDGEESNYCHVGDKIATDSYYDNHLKLKTHLNQFLEKTSFKKYNYFNITFLI